MYKSKGGEKMEPRVEDYLDSTCVASTAGSPIMDLQQ
jgi:hypothetical protein